MALGLEKGEAEEALADEAGGGDCGGGTPAPAARGNRDLIDSSDFPFSNLLNLLGSLLFDAGCVIRPPLNRWLILA
jgi:hypothetical protein